jgi:hypothetical protein
MKLLMNDKGTGTRGTQSVNLKVALMALAASTLEHLSTNQPIKEQEEDPFHLNFN